MKSDHTARESYAAIRALCDMEESMRMLKYDIERQRELIRDRALRGDPVISKYFKLDFTRMMRDQWEADRAGEEADRKMGDFTP